MTLCRLCGANIAISRASKRWIHLWVDTTGEHHAEPFVVDDPPRLPLNWLQSRVWLETYSRKRYDQHRRLAEENKRVQAEMANGLSEREAFRAVYGEGQTAQEFRAWVKEHTGHELDHTPTRYDGTYRLRLKHWRIHWRGQPARLIERFRP